MGLLAGLLLLPLAPVRGVVWIAEQVLDQANLELSDPAELREQLLELDDAKAAGRISPEEYADAQERVLADLMHIRGGWGGPPEVGT